MQHYLLSIKNNFLSSIVVFFVAVPLCLGIALASGVPLFAGIITGIIGGVVVGLISESRVSVSGPAAGMVAVVISSIHTLGSYQAFLLALFIAGIIQILSGVLRGGFIANFVPATVIKGLLAAIGILIIIKQIPLAFGYFGEPELLKNTLIFAQEDLSLQPFGDLFNHISIGATIISIISVMLMYFWEKIPFKFCRTIPSAFAVVIIAMALNALFSSFIPSLALESSHLVNIPSNASFKDLWLQFQHPDFSQFKNTQIYFSAIMIAIVASLETLLNLEAIEKLDKRHRYCSRNRELIAQGVGNMISGLVGGLPITSVIVRSSVNINAGGTSKLSTVFHGILLFFSLTLLAGWLNCIPTAALAAILIYTGYKLARISLFKEVYEEGKQYFLPFMITILAIVFTNLLLGIIIGLVVSLLFILHYNSQSYFSIVDEHHPSGHVLRLILPQQLSFLSRAATIEGLNQIPKNSKVIIDANFTDYIDNDILEIIKDFKESLAAEKNILINMEGLQKHYEIGHQTDFIDATTYDVQSSLTPLEIYKLLVEGNQRFVKNKTIHKNYKHKITATSQSQHPLAVVLSCIDSRVPVELIFDLSLGDVFVIRIAGNIANLDILGSLEFACHEAGAKLIVVLGHKSCGAIKAACEDFKLGYVTQLVEKIKPAIDFTLSHQPHLNKNDPIFMNHVAEHNVKLTKQWLYQHSDIIKKLIDEKRVGIVGGVYDVSTGIVEFEQENDLAN